LNDNGLDGGQLKHLKRYQNLHTVKFIGNNVTDYAQLEELRGLEIHNLDFSGNPIAEKQDYRDKLFEMFEELESLDR
jgi:hypothetical protein